MTTTSSSSGGTAFCNPGGDAQHSLNEPIANSGDAAKIEGILINEEERMMEHDEEIDSDAEVVDPDKEERKMLTVALVKSVVETKKDGDEKPYGLRKRRRPTGEDLRLLEHNQSTNDGGLARTAKASEAVQDPFLVPSGVRGGTSAATDDRKVGASAVHRDAEPMKPPPSNLKRPALKVPKVESPVNVPIIPASSTVPNPLSAVPIQPSTMSMHSSKAAHADSASSAVPCPLPAAAVEEKTFPPLLDSADKRKVTINEPVQRPRTFSIDLDLGQFDIAGDHSTDGDEPLGGGRPRTFSFECYSFGINADEPLPPLDDSPSTGRPRGDSIIFDPSSFQDGGIHEQSALEKARLAEGRKEPETPASNPTVTADVPVSQSAAPGAQAKAPLSYPGAALLKNPDAMAATSNPAATVRSHSGVHAPGPVTSYTTTTTTATSTTTTTTMLPSASAAATSSSFSMDLLNKDGRIGIYLPDARKARIARFHEKRARRIWRKRIKYDCRKKLADSRPRIKGRFVKRTDKEEAE